MKIEVVKNPLTEEKENILYLTDEELLKLKKALVTGENVLRVEFLQYLDFIIETKGGFSMGRTVSYDIKKDGINKITPRQWKKVKTATNKFFGHRKSQIIFEHGQWWVKFDNEEGEEKIYSVIDAEGIGTVNGFDFEEVQ